MIHICTEFHNTWIKALNAKENPGLNYGAETYALPAAERWATEI